MIFFNAKSVFLAVNGSLRWLIMLVNNVIAANHKWGILYLCIDKCGLACYLYCTKSGWRCIGRFPPALA
jgi:hypothetical protein